MKLLFFGALLLTGSASFAQTNQTAGCQVAPVVIGHSCSCINGKVLKTNKLVLNMAMSDGTVRSNLLWDSFGGEDCEQEKRQNSLCK